MDHAGGVSHGDHMAVRVAQFEKAMKGPLLVADGHGVCLRVRHNRAGQQRNEIPVSEGSRREMIHSMSA
jgi:hypothetical protein